MQEKEFFQDSLKTNQRRLLKVTRDRSFLLDRLLQFEKPEVTSSESDGSESEFSDSSNVRKRKLVDQNSSNHNYSLLKNPAPKRKRLSNPNPRPKQPPQVQQQQQQIYQIQMPHQMISNIAGEEIVLPSQLIENEEVDINIMHQVE